MRSQAPGCHPQQSPRGVGTEAHTLILATGFERRLCSPCHPGYLSRRVSRTCPRGWRLPGGDGAAARAGGLELPSMMLLGADGHALGTPLQGGSAGGGRTRL